MSNYEPIDNDEDAVEFDVEKIEQMEVEFKTCYHCGGEGNKRNGFYTFTCPVCHGCGEKPKEAKPNDRLQRPETLQAIRLL